MSPLLFPLWCTCHMPDYLPISFVCQSDTPHTHSFLLIVCVCRFLLSDTPILAVSCFLILHLPSFSITLLLSFSLFLTTSLCLFFSLHLYLSLPLPLPRSLLLSFSLPFIFLLFSLKIIVSPPGKKSGCIRVMRKFKSLKADCTSVYKANLSQCECVCISACASVCICVFFSVHAFAYLCRGKCVHICTYCH